MVKVHELLNLQMPPILVAHDLNTCEVLEWVVGKVVVSQNLVLSSLLV